MAPNFFGDSNLRLVDLVDSIDDVEQLLVVDVANRHFDVFAQVGGAVDAHLDVIGLSLGPARAFLKMTAELARAAAVARIVGTADSVQGWSFGPIFVF